jgi:pimeloyl-ACP methyl ester carboxylesterase
MLQRQLPTVASVLPDICLGTITGVVETPETRYAKSGDVHIAYPGRRRCIARSRLYPARGSPRRAELGEPSDRAVPGEACRARTSDCLRQAGTGMSDRVVGMLTLETRMDDVRAVMDAAGSDRAVLFAVGDAGPLCALFAASFPERTLGLVLVNSTPRFVRGPNFPWLPSRGEAEQRIEENSGELSIRRDGRSFSPSRIRT